MHDGFDDPNLADDRPAPDLRLLVVRGVKRHWFAVCVAIALGTAGGIAAGLVQPNTYVSKAKLLLRVGAHEQVTAESFVDPDENRRSTGPTMSDELQMLSDDVLFEQVARTIGPREILQPADPRRDDDPDTSPPIALLHTLQWTAFHTITPQHSCASLECATCLRRATKTLIENTTIMNEPGSNVIQVSHVSSSPERAREVLKSLGKAFVERHREQFSMQPLVEANRHKVDEAKKARDDAVNAYIAQVNQSGFEDVDPQLPALQTAITAIETELFAARVREKAITHQRSSLSGRLEEVPAEVEVPGTTVMIPNEEYETQLMLKRGLLTQRQAVALEGRTIEETHRREKILDDQIAKADEKLKRLPKAVAQNAEMRENVGHTSLSTKVEDLELEDQELAVKIGLLQDRLTEKQTQLQEQRKKLLLATLRRKDLESARDAAESTYKQLLARFSMLESLAGLERHEDPNLRVLQPATLDPEKVGPKRFSLLLKGLFLGLALGIAYAMLRQGLERRILQPDAFERERGVPLLGVVPELPLLRRLSTRPADGWS
jgi:uncharacterized protein involved in exopolysaccharide biosynthesis